METGKLPPGILGSLLQGIPIEDNRVLIRPDVGEDAALIDYGDRILIAKSDPITFASDLIGWYVVQINANDIAAMGGIPKWFLCTLLLPETINEDEIREIFSQLVSACAAINVTLVGGHTEVTGRVDVPIATGFMLGEVDKGKQVLSSGAEVGDSIILSKGVAIEGTAVLAREDTETLLLHGMSPRSVEKAKTFLFDPGISVLKEVTLLQNKIEIHAMHDPTEGGIATGLQEIGFASQVGMEIKSEKICVFQETREICSILNLDPLGLLASGALIIVVPEEQTDAALTILREGQIDACTIGRVVPQTKGLLMRNKIGLLENIPTFRRDEIARYFAEHTSAT